MTSQQLYVERKEKYSSELDTLSTQNFTREHEGYIPLATPKIERIVFLEV